MKFLLTIDCTTNAFGDTASDRAQETARILTAIAARLTTVGSDRRHPEDYHDGRNGWTGHFQTILDADGNDVGRYSFKPEDYR